METVNLERMRLQPAPELWEVMNALGWGRHEQTIFEAERMPTIPSAQDISSHIPRAIRVDPLVWNTRLICLRIKQGEDGTWTIGYHKTQLMKGHVPGRFLIKHLTWHSKRLVDALAACWIGLKEQGLLPS